MRSALFRLEYQLRKMESSRLVAQQVLELKANNLEDLIEKGKY